jgi:hypothetical protein
MCIFLCIAPIFQKRAKCFGKLAGTTGLEPAASAVTGQRSNQLNYVTGLTTGLPNWWEFRTRTCDLLLVSLLTSRCLRMQAVRKRNKIMVSATQIHNALF